MLKAAPLIHSRTKFIDFRTHLFARPEDFNTTDVEKTKKYILSSTLSVEELDRSSECRKLIFINGDNVIFGITAFMAYFNSRSNNALKDILVDQTGIRDIYLFVGLVVKKSALNCAIAFPDDKYFVKAIEQYLIPRWEEKSHYEGSLNASLTQYDFCIESDELTNSDIMEINTEYINKTMVFPNPNNLSETSLGMAIREIVNGKDVSVCTNFPIYEIKKSFFMNATSSGISENTILCNSFNEKETTTDFSNEQNKEISPKPQPIKVHDDTNAKKKIQNIVKHLLCIGAIVICGSYIIFADKKMITYVLIASGVGLGALIVEIIDLINHSDFSKTTKDTDELKAERYHDITVDKRKKNNNEKNNDDIFKL